jgi:D-arabinose 1-dehydrogenase-like Zn-dependent alcohol dehydrogenase
MMEGRSYVPRLPHILGHEPAGVVAAVGAEVTNVRVGERVVPSLFFNCDECYYCRVRKTFWARFATEDLPSTSRFRDAAFWLPHSISFEAGGIIADAVVTAVQAAKRGGLVPGSAAVVIGGGGLGLCLVQVLAGAGVRVAVPDIDMKKLSLAESYGAKAAFFAKQAISVVKSWRGIDGVQCVFGCVGSSQSLADACRTAMNGGGVVVVGEHDQRPVTSTRIAQRELEIIVPC